MLLAINDLKIYGEAQNNKRHLGFSKELYENEKFEKNSS